MHLAHAADEGYIVTTCVGKTRDLHNLFDIFVQLLYSSTDQ